MRINNSLLLDRLPAYSSSKKDGEEGQHHRLAIFPTQSVRKEGRQTTGKWHLEAFGQEVKFLTKTSVTMTPGSFQGLTLPAHWSDRSSIVTIDTLRKAPIQSKRKTRFQNAEFSEIGAGVKGKKIKIARMAIAAILKEHKLKLWWRQVQKQTGRFMSAMAIRTPCIGVISHWQSTHRNTS